MNALRPVGGSVECVRVPGRADGEDNVWFVGDRSECAVIDPAGEVGSLLGRCDSRRLKLILWTTLRPESVETAVALAHRTGAVMFLDKEDLPIWRRVEPEIRPHCSVPAGLVLTVAGLRLESIHTPGVTPGALCWYAPLLAAVFTGQTLGLNGPGGADLPAAAGSTLLASVRTGLFTLPAQTVVHPGQGNDSRIGTQRWDRRFWG